MGLADTGRTEEDNVLGARDEGEPGEFVDLLARNTGGKAEVKAVELRATSRPALCLLCDHAFTTETGGPAAIVVMAGNVDAPKRVGNVLCHRCFAVDDAELKRRIFAVYRDSLMGGDARILSEQSAPGHA